MPTHDPTKMPSDAKIVQAFTRLEETFVVLEAIWNNQSAHHVPRLDDTALSTLWDAHAVARLQANAAQKRLDAKAERKAAK